MKRKQRIKNLLIEEFKELSVNIIDNSKYHIGHNKFDGNNETHLRY